MILGPSEADDILHHQKCPPSSVATAGLSINNKKIICSTTKL
jgi:hypothetical protein